MHLKKILLPLLLVAFLVPVSACGSDAEKTTDGGKATGANYGKALELDTSNGKITVTSPDLENGPAIEMDPMPYTVDETQVFTLSEGDGEVVPAGATVLVNYHGVNANTGDVFDSSFERGQAASFSVDRVVAGFRKAIVGQKVGSDVLVVMTPEDGYGDLGNPPAIKPGDYLAFLVRIEEIQ